MSEMEPIEDALADENKHLAIDLSRLELPLDMAIRSTALTLAVRHTGDRTVKEGNLYQQLKMDNKLGGPLDVNHVLHAALIFERFLWGEWSKGIAGEAMDATMAEVETILKRDSDKFVDETNPDADYVKDDPIAPHGGAS